MKNKGVENFVNLMFSRVAFVLAFAFVFAAVPPTHGSESYFLGGNPVLIYKAVNWWYDCLPEESTRLCGQSVAYENKGGLKAEYLERDGSLKLILPPGFADRVLIFNRERGPSFLKCTWVNDRYLGGGSKVIIGEETDSLSGFCFINVNKHQAGLIRSILDNLAVRVEGRVMGLASGRISLHRQGDLIKRCPAVPGGSAPSSASIKLFLAGGRELLAHYSVSYGQ